MKPAQLIGSKERVLSLLVAKGWPKNVGLNDKHRTSHNRLTLDRRTVHTFWTNKATGFFVYDPALELVTTGESLDAALIAMVNARETLAARDSGPQAPPRDA